MQSPAAADYGTIFSVLADLIEVGIVVVNPSGEIDFASRKARELLGCDDRLHVEACHPELVSTMRDMIAQVSSSYAKSVQKEEHVSTPKGRRRLSLTIHPLVEDDCAGYLVEVKDAEIMRRMATDLRLAAQFRNVRRLSQALVEDLKQPISAVLLHLDLLRNSTLPKDNGAGAPRASRSFEVIRRQMVELNRALTLLLEEMDPSDAEEQGFSLRDVLQDVVRFIEPQAAQQGIDIERSDDGHPARLTGSRQRLKQALVNLVVNALDAMPGGGRLSINLSVASAAACVEVTDTGCGIEADVLPHIFEMHFTTKESGTGVGLYVARDVVEKHGGSIAVASTRPGAGSTFAVTIPVHHSAR